MDRLVDVPEAASLLSVSVWTIRKWAREGRLAFVKLGGTVRFRPVELERFVRRGASAAKLRVDARETRLRRPGAR